MNGVTLRSLAIACALIGVSMLAGCGGSQQGQAEWHRGYIGVSRNRSVTFVRLERAGHHLRGTVIGTVFVPRPKWPRGSYQKQHFIVTGTISGSHVLLHYPHGVDAKGTVSPSLLLVRSTQQAPPGDPPLHLMPMRRATLADYRAYFTEIHG
ncbi:MAG: hypothetical protein QOG85_471 [Gaiellaceae bacterium]|jgi:hypothetical protein|nr:hypothetical protein [Gaiellaceae bacterium]